jgi:hypothetical protein
MPHPDIRNGTAFAYESLMLMDEEAVPQFVPLIQGTYSILPDGIVEFLEEQPPINIVGEWYGDPAESSMRLEPQMAFAKSATDVVMLGHAHAQHAGTTRMQVGIRIGQTQKLATVMGDRRLVKHSGSVHVSDPEPFEKMPLVYERAFGGWDRRAERENQHSYEARNPAGTGFRDPSADSDDEFALPNIEHPDHPYRQYGDTPPPVGFGFIPPNWQPRAGLAGTFDQVWSQSRKPLLPRDFDRRFYNAASVGLVAPGFLQGGESVVTLNVAVQGRFEFALPQEATPQFFVELRGRNYLQLAAQLDTVIIDMDQLVLTLQWRAHAAVRGGMDDVVSVEVRPG